MINIIFESHSTTVDNETNKASGHYDVELSEKGRLQAKKLGERHTNTNIEVIFTSDLQRAVDTTQIAFEDRNILVVKDARLRECDYGEMTRGPKDEVEADRINRLYTPYPGGESIEQRVEKVREFLNEIAPAYPDKTIMIIGHRATRIALEHILNNKTLEVAASEPNVWQPGWHYTLESTGENYGTDI